MAKIGDTLKETTASFFGVKMKKAESSSKAS
jgi:hypothetical protein